MNKPAFRPFFLLFFLLAAASCFSTPAAALIAPEEILNLETYVSLSGVAPGTSFELAVQVQLKEGWHINSDKPSYEFAIPTELTVETPEGVVFEPPVFPIPTAKLKVPGTDEVTELFEGSFLIRLKGEVKETIQAGKISINGSLYYQGCNDETCLRPTEKPFSVPLRVLPTGQTGRLIHPEIFTGAASPGEPIPEADAEGFFDTGDVSGALAKKGLAVTLLLVFLGGLALNLTPCVYPLIPITISYFGGQQTSGSPVPRAVAYVAGICLMYSSLGVAAALSGKMFGALLASPVVLLLIAGLMVALALSMFGLYEIRMPTALMNMGGTARAGVMGSLFMGLTMGIVAAPCIGPFVVGLLTYVATLGSPTKGFLLFFALSLGLGMPYLFLGIFSGKLSSMPKSGEWMLGVRKIFGCVLLVMAVYFLNPLLEAKVYHGLLFAVLLASGLFLVIGVPSGKENRFFHIMKSLVAISMIMAATWIIKPAGTAEEGLVFEPYTEARRMAAMDEGRPVMIDFYADWCIPCKELDAITFKDSRVRAFSDRFVFLKADLTLENERTGKWKKHFDVRGVPTLVFFGADGQERKNLRLTGFEEPESFVKRLEQMAGEE